MHKTAGAVSYKNPVSYNVENYSNWLSSNGHYSIKIKLSVSKTQMHIFIMLQHDCVKSLI